MIRDRAMTLAASVVVAILLGLLTFSVWDQRQANNSLREANEALTIQLDKSDAQREENEAMLRVAQDTLDILVRRIRQLERFIRSLGLEPPASTQSSSQGGGDGADSGSSDEGPKPADPPGGPKPKPTPKPPPPDEPGPFDEVCDLVNDVIPICD